MGAVLIGAPILILLMGSTATLGAAAFLGAAVFLGWGAAAFL